MSTFQPSLSVSTFPTTSIVPTAGPTGAFTYLGGGVAIVFCIYGVIGVISLVIYLKYYYKKEVYEFKTAYESTIQEPYMVVVLGLYRFICFVFFLAFAGIYVWVVIYPGSSGAKNYQYYTYWNVGMAFFYYFIATIASVLGYICKPMDGKDWSPAIVYFGLFHRIIFSVAGSTAFFITVVNFSLLSSAGTFANISDHLIPSISFFVEMFLNTTTVPVYNLFYMITWAIAWISFVLIIYPGTGVLNGWPYFFLKAYSPALYYWYPILIILMVVFYFIWYGLSWIKVKYIIDPSSGGVKMQLDNNGNAKGVNNNNDDDDIEQL